MIANAPSMGIDVNKLTGMSLKDVFGTHNSGALSRAEFISDSLVSNTALSLPLALCAVWA